MRPSLFVALLIIFLSSYSSYCQDVDSMTRAVDSSSSKIEQATQKFDSLQNSKNLEEFLRPMEEREKTQKTQTIIYIGLGVAFLGLLIYGAARNKKKETPLS